MCLYVLVVSKRDSVVGEKVLAGSERIFPDRENVTKMFQI